MNSQKRLWLGLLVMLFFACRQDVEKFVPNPPIDVPIIGEIDNFFQALQSDLPTQEYQFNAEWGRQIITPHETIIDIPTNAFVDLNGNIVSGPVKLEILELYEVGEMIMFGQHTVSDGGLLSSDGEFFIEAFQDGKPLRLADGVQIKFSVPNDDPIDKMELFYGEERVETEFGTTSFNWIQADDDPTTWDNVQIGEWAIQDSTQGIFGFGYECFSDSLKWINLDVFNDIPEEERTDICVELPEGFGNTNTVVYIVFNDINSFIQLTGNPETMQWCNYYTQFITVGVPIGADVTIVSISEQGEDCYFLGTSNTTIVVNHLESIIPVKTPLEDIKDFLMSL